MGPGQIFDSHVHPLKLVHIKNPFGILPINPQIPWEWVGLFDFKKKTGLAGTPY